MDSNSTVDSRLASAFQFFNCSILILTLLLGLPGNLWVCWLVFRTKSLQNCNNALLVSLAASDLLKCSVDTPLFLFSCLWSGKETPGVVCSVQQFAYSLSNCVQLLTLVSISVERCHAIAFPFHMEKRRLRVSLWILCIWTCGFILGAVSLSLSGRSPFHVLCSPYNQEQQYWDPFGPYVLVPLWGLSLVVIVIHYGRIFKVVQQHRKKVFCLGIEPSQAVSKDAWAWRSDQRPHLQAPPLLLVAAVGDSCTGAAAARPPEIVGAVCPLNPGSKERRKTHVEGKVAQRFGYIIIAFTLFWLPIVLMLLVRATKWRHTNRLLMELEMSAMVLTCVQAAVDPLIYTLVTRQFRSELRKIFSSVRRCPLKLRM
ncbi:G-protein coupled receptor 83-like [Synchiropus picturatus]